MTDANEWHRLTVCRRYVRAARDSEDCMYVVMSGSLAAGTWTNRYYPTLDEALTAAREEHARPHGPDVVVRKRGLAGIAKADLVLLGARS